MATRYTIPKPNESLLDQFGKLSTPWYNYLRTRFGDEAAEGVAQQIADLTARVTALEEDQGTDARIIGPASVAVIGNLADGLVQLLLDGDEVSPLPVSLYSTGDDGRKGWNPLYPNWVPNPYADYILDPDGNYLTDPDGNFLMSQDGFPIPLEYGGTGADNSSVAANLVWASPDGMAGAPVFRALVGDDLPVPLPDLVAGGTTGQFWRGDGAWSNAILGDFGVGTATPNLSGSGREFAVSTLTSGTLARYHMQGSQASGGLAIGALQAWNGAQQIAQFVCSTGTTTSTGVFRITTRGPLDAVPQNRLLIGEAGETLPGADNIQPLGSSSLRWSNTFTYNLTVGQNAPSFGGGIGVQFIGNAATVPTSNPTGGGILYVEAGALKYRGSSGTVTVLALA